MFTNARLYLKTAFYFFILGLLSGLYLYGAKLFGWFLPYTLISAHAHLILMGGVYMMILGVAIWFFPRAEKDDLKYRPTRILSLYWIFTISTGLRFISEIGSGVDSGFAWGRAGFAMSAIQAFAAIGLVYSIWGRIRPVGSQIREKRGERF